MGQLLKVGGKLAVLGVEDGRRAMGWWHVARPGTLSVEVASCGVDGEMLRYGTALCGRRVVTNGYAADWRPPVGVLCPGCREQI